MQHPLLQPIHDILYRDGKVLLFQPLVTTGSLRDHLHGVRHPIQDWAEKYKDKGKKRMSRDEIAECARSIIEAI